MKYFEKWVKRNGQPDRLIISAVMQHGCKKLTLILDFIFYYMFYCKNIIKDVLYNFFSCQNNLFFNLKLDL